MLFRHNRMKLIRILSISATLLIGYSWHCFCFEAEGLEDQIQQSLAMGSYTKLYTQCEMWLKLDPQNPTPQFLLYVINLYNERKNMNAGNSPYSGVGFYSNPEVLQWLKKTSGNYPRNKEVILAISMYYQADQNLSLAEKSFKEASRYCDNDDSCLANVGIFFMYELKNEKKAQPYFLKAVKINPSNFWANAGLSVIFNKQGNMKAAGPHYAFCANIKPNNQRILFNQAGMFMSLGYYGRGRRLYSEVIVMSSSTALARESERYLFPIPKECLKCFSTTDLKRLTSQYMLQHDSAKFAELADEWILRDSSNPVVNVVQFVRDVLLKDGTDKSRAVRLRNVLKDAGARSKVLIWLNDLKQQYPENRADINNLLGDAYLHSGDVFKGIEYAKDVVKLRGNAQNHIDLGEAYYILGKYDDALHEYLEAVRVGPTYAKAYFVLALYEVDRAHVSKAIGYAKKALELDPFYEEARQLLETLHDSVDGWLKYPQEGTILTLNSEEGGKPGALIIGYDLKSMDWVQIYRDFPKPLNDRDEFKFSMKWEGEKNNFEFKVVDQDGSNFGKKFEFPDRPGEWHEISIPIRELKYWWGGNKSLSLDHGVYLWLAISKLSSGGKGQVYIRDLECQGQPIR